MSLPPLPEHPWRFSPNWDEEETKELQAYGQQCRAQALEDAAMAAEVAAENALDGYQIADNIRSLK